MHTYKTPHESHRRSRKPSLCMCLYGNVWGNLNPNPPLMHSHTNPYDPIQFHTEHMQTHTSPYKLYYMMYNYMGLYWNAWVIPTPIQLMHSQPVHI